MSKYQIKITLLSDLCVSDGGVYNSMIDVDVCYDAWGFPYIPAKRLKGCLRECACEWNDWGGSIQTEAIFGTEGSGKGDIRLSNAYLENYQEMRQEIADAGSHMIVHPQNILNQFTYLRTQTSVDTETGVAEDGSLRTMRVIKKGLIFYSEVSLDKTYKEDLERCCTIFTHLGMARTRGLGEVEVSLVDKVSEVEQRAPERGKSQGISLEAGSIGLEYEIEFREPVILKSLNRGEANTADFIDGAKVLGLIAQQSKKEGKDAFLNLMRMGSLICSNAYLASDGMRLTEVPACYYEVKNEHSFFVDQSDLSYSAEEIRKDSDILQLSGMKHCYVGQKDGSLFKKSVEKEEHYHHRRPNDKGIGRAQEVEREIHGGIADTEGGNSHFYQMSAIRAGQTMRGYVISEYWPREQGEKSCGTEGNVLEPSPEEQIKKVYKYLKELDEVPMGYARNAEYGMVGFRLVGCLKEKDIIKKEKKIKDFMVKLESPMIVYGSQAAYTLEPSVLEEEIRAVLFPDGTRKIRPYRSFLKYTTVGGYNVTWNMKKPVIDAFDKGSVLCYHLDEGVSISQWERIFAGERNAEGFGELSVRELVVDSEGKNEGWKKVFCEDGENQDSGELSVEGKPFLNALCGKLFYNYMYYRVIQSIKEKEAAWKSKMRIRAVVSNMRSILKEQKTIEDVKKEVELRYPNDGGLKWEKRETAECILNACTGIIGKVLKEFEGKYRIKQYPYFRRNEKDNSGQPNKMGKEWNDSMEKTYLVMFLTELQHLLRNSEDKEG